MSRDFEKRMRQIASQVESRFTRGLGRVMDVVQTTVISGTPVKTGRARNGWRVGVGSPDETPADMVGPFDTSGQVRIDENRAAISQAQPGQEFYLSNKVHYIKDLNNGTSLQAPAGFVQTAAMIAVNEAKKIRLLDDSAINQKLSDIGFFDV